MGALAANIGRNQVQEWLGDLRVGGSSGTRLQFAGDCSQPCEIFCRGLPDKILVGLKLEPETQRVATLLTRCRKCAKCLRHRQQLWAARAVDEITVSGRTWFGTLTLSPEKALQLQYASELRKVRQGWQLAELADTDRFQAIREEASVEVTKWLKRVRKNSGATLRYLLVCEHHKSGMPHWHILLHERSGKVLKRKLEASWGYGFTHFRLVPPGDNNAAYYCAKYLGKSAEARLRASLQYGSPSMETIAEKVEHLLGELMFQTTKHDATSPTVKMTQQEMMIPNINSSIF